MTKDDDIRALAKQFFDAIEQGDIETMQSSFAPDAQIWHNTDELIVTVEQTVQTLTAMVSRIKNRRYADRQLTVFPGGFVQQHVVTGQRVHDDVDVRLPCAIICKVENGKITRLDEYFDSAHVAAFRKYA
ncbi:nuclear transport factor 2 family protein [Parasphingorhabdus sp.]|uniref:nuclear transport factor 2 family protein n=1 Tax=Parasphingorhabdus sp. TaxID=2709688 RepID=UPI002F944477